MALTVTLKFRTLDGGWTERYPVYGSDSTPPISYLGKAQSICEARLKCCAASVQLAQFTISDEFKPGQSLVSARYDGTPGGFTNTRDVPDLAVPVRLYSRSRNYQGTHWLRGVPDSEVTWRLNVPVLSGPLIDALFVFAQALIFSGVGIRAKFQAATGDNGPKRITGAQLETGTNRLALNIASHGYSGGDEVNIKGCTFENTAVPLRTVIDQRTHRVITRGVNRRHLVIPPVPGDLSPVDWFTINVVVQSVAPLGYHNDGVATRHVLQVQLAERFVVGYTADSRSTGLNPVRTRGRRVARTRGVY